MKEELLALLEEYLVDCKTWPVLTGAFRPIESNDDGTVTCEEIITHGIQPTFTSFIEWLRTKV